MKIQFEPQEEYVSVTIEDDADAKKFCKIAAQVVCDVDSWEDVPGSMKKIYAEYGERQASENTLHWDRRLWDFVVSETKFGPVRVRLTFGQMLMHELGLA